MAYPPTAAGGAADRDQAAGCETERVEREPHGEAVHRHRRRLDQAEPLGDRGGGLAVHDHELGVRASPVGDEPRHRGDPVAGVPASARSRGIDRAGELETCNVGGLARHDGGEAARAEERVGGVDRRRGDPDADLTLAGLGVRQVDEPENLGPAVPGEADCVHRRVRAAALCSAWTRCKSELGYATYEDVARALPLRGRLHARVQQVAENLKHFWKQNPAGILMTVDRAGNNIAFKFKTT